MFERPDLVEVNSSSDESSDEDETTSQMNIVHKKIHRRSSAKVAFSETMEIREFALTVGDHPYTPIFCLSLDWEHVSTEKVPLPDDDAWNSRRPRRLSESERRERLDTFYWFDGTNLFLIDSL